MDTRFFGPAGWQLLHLIAAEDLDTHHKKDLFLAQQYILPCRFCRESTIEFMSAGSDYKYREPADRWLYDLHNRVNKKLRDQCAEDPKVICPPVDPTFSDIKKRYLDLLKKTPNVPPGMDFLFCVVYNYKDVTPEKTRRYQDFFDALLPVYPYPHLREITMKYTSSIDLTDRASLVRWFKPMMKELCKATGSKVPCVQKYAEYSSSCKRGKTCRNRKKQRKNHRRTYKLTHSRLIH